MKKYSVLFAVDVPHYGPVDIEAAGDAEALTAVRAYWERVEAGNELEPAFDPHWDSKVCARIVHIEAPDGEEIARDVPLDQFHLRCGGEADRRLCEAAPDLLAEAIKAVALMKAAGVGFNETGLAAAIAKAGGQP